MVKSNVIHGPTIDGDRRNSLWCGYRGLAQSHIQSGKNCAKRPAKRIAILNGPIWNAVDQLKCGMVIVPPKERDTTTLCAKINSNSSPLVELVRQF